MDTNSTDPYAIYIVGSVTIDYMLILPLKSQSLFNVGEKSFPSLIKTCVGGGAMNCSITFRALNSYAHIFPISSIGNKQDRHHDLIIDTFIQHHIENIFIRSLSQQETSFSMIINKEKLHDGSKQVFMGNPSVIALRLASKYIQLPAPQAGKLLYISSIHHDAWKNMLKVLPNWTKIQFKAMNPNPEQLLEWAKKKILLECKFYLLIKKK